MTRLPLILALACALGTSEARADGFPTGTVLSESCASDVAAKQGFCLGYLFGVADEMTNEVPRTVCLPADITMNQVKAQMLDDLKDNPRMSLGHALTLLRATLTFHYPCPK